ncbi:insulin-like receptor [Cimex lectularius]|uniref:Tyrosine-protein kinase receptor n=1 Tax=Cimex lectularius TaxID=79782 RepID=A0A8I6S3C4_CIMLE|nr:insulin-like receptor [Cimex lectularius]XP_014256337.1 insulin-like receptor [Cimex lectularius]XP_014256338.1 insulin-like receptor [Cimex lectularius]XP_024086185.1 insulin-like receptor [Cimex lectularius]
MFKKWRKRNAISWNVVFSLMCVLSLIFHTATTHRYITDDHGKTVLNEPGVCSSKDIRNSVESFSQLNGCQIVEGFVHIVLIDKATDADYANITFPELKEITDYLLLYRVHGLRSLGSIFPNLAVIRGNHLFKDYALVVFEMLHLQEIGLSSLTHILRGSVNLSKNPVLCFVDTIDWDLIAHNGKGVHHIAGNKLQNECPMCPPINHTCPTSATTGEPLCWNSHHCQRVCPKHCNGSCNAAGDCCNASCIGGCTGSGSDNCISCRHVLFENKCVSKCPANTYKYMNRRCIVESVCYDMPKPVEIVDSNIGHNPWKPFQGECIMECKSGYIEKEVILKGQKRNQCEPCEGVCKKECPGANVDSIAAAQKLRGCTYIKGALEIQIRGGSNVVKELDENLSMIEEIEYYLKIVRSFPLVSLNFLKNLREIHGKKLESSKYGLVVLDNQNLIELWDWKSREPSFHIRRGKLFFHFNPKLCISKIDKLREVAQLPEYTDLEVAINSNGDKVACNVTELIAEVKTRSPQGALIRWKQFEHYDTRTLLGYVVYSIEAPYRNITLYDGRDGCGGDGWRVDDIAPMAEDEKRKLEKEGQELWLKFVLTRLKAYTQYAFYVKTYTIATERSGAQSPILYFRTAPYIPSEPRSLTAYSNSSFEIVINWLPPSKPNGNVTYYIVTGQWEKGEEEHLEQRNFCLEPYDNKRTSHSIAKPEQHPETTDKPDSSNKNCACANKVPDNKIREKEIHFEDHLQNTIYIKRTDSVRNKRDVSDRTTGKFILMENVMGEGFQESFTRIVRGGTSLVVKNLRHFAHYNIAVNACRELEEDENKNNTGTCSSSAFVTAKTLPLANADNIDDQFLQWEISNKSLGFVLLRWNEPPRPNGFIVAYQIEYRRTDIENFKPNIECITRKQFRDANNSYMLKNLGPGNYSLRVRATSYGGEGNFTPVKYFYIEEESQISVVYISLMFSTALIITALVCVIYFRRQYTQVPNRKLIASVNPEYVPTVYEPDDWEVPRTRVDLIKEIGQGSFGMVWEGILKNVDGTQELPCAVKTVNDQAADRDRIEFLNEASVMKAFNTHHVVKLLGVVSQGQPTLVIMELMCRGDLKSYLRSHRPDLPDNPKQPCLKRILRMAAEIADGMAYLSAKKFVHRDLAARNCMVAEDLTVKIGDFGMTRDIYETEYYRKGSKGLLPVRWMAPESLKDGVFTSHSDAWSYGVVLYEMATLASQPYQGLSNDQVLRYVIEGGIMERPERCPDKLFQVMKLCWRHKPSSRPSFLELVTLLQDDVDPDFQNVSFYHSEEGVDLRAAVSTEDTPLSISREIEDFSLSDEEDYKEPHSSTSSKMSNGSTTPNGYVPQHVVKTTKC